MNHYYLFLLFVICSNITGDTEPRGLVVEVDAGQHERRGTLVHVLLPAGEKVRDGAFRVEPLDDTKLTLGQADAGTVVWALGEPLPAGAKRRFRLTPAEGAGRKLDTHDGFAFTDHADSLELNHGNRVVLKYHTKAVDPPSGIDAVFRRSGFVHPLSTPLGVVVSDDFPPDHAHQHGVFFAWVNTTFDGRKVDFWNQLGRTGRVEHAGGLRSSGGPLSGSFAASLRHDDLTAPGGPASVLDERWYVRVHRFEGCYVLDFESEQTCAGLLPLKINKYHYGGFGFRGNRQWFDPSARGDSPPDPARSGRSDFLTSEGKHRANGNHTRPRWVDVSGAVDGRIGGVTILDHPGNFRHPQPVRLHPNKPYFCFAPMVLGEFEIAPGQTYTSRYRLIVHDGPPDPVLIERLWADYADPPQVRVVETEP